MSTETFELVYDGPDLVGHQMDVRDLVPALRGLGDLIRAANSSVNGEKTAVRVLINSEHRLGCFAISVDVLQTLVDGTKQLLSDDGVKTTKDLLEWLELLGFPTAAGVIGYLKWRNGRATVVSSLATESSGVGAVQANIQGDNNNIVIVPPEVHRLSSDPSIARAIKELVRPLKTLGIEKLFARSAQGEGMRIDKGDVSSIERSCDAVISDEIVLSRNVVIAHLRPYDAEFNPDAKTWGFWHGTNHITVDITDTSIAKEAVERRRVSMDDVYKVDLEITERRLPSGIHRNDYRILTVYERKQGATQIDLFGEDQNEEPGE